LDGSAKSESTLPLAGQLAERWQAEILALRVTDPAVSTLDPMTTSLYESMVGESQRYLDDLKTRYADLSLHTVHEIGSPQACIEQLAANQSCELILMATHGHEGLLRWLWGSVAEGVTRHAPCPIMLVRDPETPIRFRKILVPTDGSEESLSVTQRIGRFLHPETRVTLLHCFGDHPQVGADPMELAKVRGRLRQQVDGRPWLTLEFAASPAPQGILTGWSITNAI